MDTVHISESYIKLGVNENEQINLLESGLNVHLQIKEKVGDKIRDVPYDLEAKRYFRVIYTIDEIYNSTFNSTFLAEAGPCNATGNLTLCPNDIDLFKAKILANYDHPLSKRFNVKINKCTGYSNCVTN